MPTPEELEKVKRLGEACQEVAAGEELEEVDMSDALKAINIISIAIKRLSTVAVMPELTRGEPISDQTIDDLNTAIQVGLISMRFLFDYVASERGV